MTATTHIFHGSNVEVARPEVLVQGFYKDFGYGFYCTRLEKQARRWAAARQGGHVVSMFDYLPDDSLSRLSFPSMTEEWLDFVVACRRGEPHDYDIVEGPMADDQIWDYVEDLANDEITREAFWVLAKFRHPTHQIAFCTDRALTAIHFLNSYEV